MLPTGYRRFLIARAMEDRAQLELCRDLTSATHTVVCRLTARLEVMEERVKSREPGLLQRELCARVAKLNAILDAVRLEDITVANAESQCDRRCHGNACQSRMAFKLSCDSHYRGKTAVAIQGYNFSCLNRISDHRDHRLRQCHLSRRERGESGATSRRFLKAR